MLSSGLKQAILQLEAGHLQVSEAIKSEACATREFTRERLSHAENAINERIAREREYAITEDQRQRLLRSLKYSRMNERRTLIKDSHEKTFHWVLKRPIEFSDVNNEPEDSNHEATSLRYDSSSDDGSLNKSFESDASTLWQGRWPNFIEWLESDDTKYWISGKPGAGKSTLVRFLIENPKTATSLNQWRDGTEILSHFFWKLGGAAQQNLRGFWSSLAHQRLLNNPNILDDILSTFATAKTKDEPSDWSEKELRDICLEILGRGSQPLCIFLDGLDEIADSDGAPGVIGAIDDIIMTLAPNIKICFACRPEHRFKIRLAGVPELKVHLLTRRDMCRMVRSEISRCCSSLTVNTKQDEQFRQKVERTVVQKAAGVFMWLVLALKTVQLGFENGDSEEELLSRVEGLPSGIENLYEDMWSRLGSSEPTYREKGAEFLSLAVRDLELQESYPHMHYEIGLRLLLGQVAIATHPILRTKLHSSSDAVDCSMLEAECKNTKQAIETRTSGLLEVIDNTRNPDEIWTNPVTFIHRTAYDYLTTTNHGSKILAACSISPYQTHIHLVCGFLGLNSLVAPNQAEMGLAHTDYTHDTVDLRWVLTHLDRAALYGIESSLQSKALRHSFELFTGELIKAEEACTLEYAADPPIELISSWLGFGCCEPWALQITQERGRNPNFLSVLLNKFMESMEIMMSDCDSSTKSAQGMDELDSKVRHCCRTIRSLISLGASVHFVDYGSQFPLSVRTRWLAACAHSAKHLSSVVHGWCLEILASLIKVIDDLPTTILIRGELECSDTPKLTIYTLADSQNARESHRFHIHERKAKSGKHENSRSVVFIKLELKVSLAFCVSMLLDFDGEGTETPVSEPSILREFCNQGSKELLHTPESVYLWDRSSSQAGLYFLKYPHPGRPARIARLWGRSWWLSLLSSLLDAGDVVVTIKERDFFVREIEELQENGILQPVESSGDQLPSRWQSISSASSN